MARLFLILLILLLAVLLWRVLHKKIDKQARTKKGGPKALELIRCDYCGLHVPAKSALLRQGRRYCSEEHMRVDNNR